MSNTEHKKWTGLSNDLVLENAKMMAKMADVRITLTLIPGVNDSKKNVLETVEFSRSLGVNKIDVLTFHKLGTCKYEYLGLKSPLTHFGEISDEKIEEVLKIIESYGIKTTEKRMM
jgi:pyruvate formate lyase activating enzyme